MAGLNISSGKNNALSPAKADAIGRRMGASISTGGGSVAKPLHPSFGATLTGFGKGSGSTFAKPGQLKLPNPAPQGAGSGNKLNPFAQF